MVTSVETSNMKWVRSKDGWLAGVCQGLGERLRIEPWILRATLVIAICWFGTGFFFYSVLALCLPREDKMEMALQKRFLGVCAQIAYRYGFEVGLVRVFAVIVAIGSFGFFMFGYLVVYIFLPKDPIIVGAMGSFDGARRS